MQFIKTTWQRSAVGKIIIGALAFVIGCCACSFIALVIPTRPQQRAEATVVALAASVEPQVTIFATQPPTLAPEPTATPAPTLTTAPTDVPLPTVEPATPTTQIDAPTALPVAPEAQPAVPSLVSAVATGMDGDRPFVDPPWLPCEQNQIKGNANPRSMIYHMPTGAHYKFTFTDIRCFNTEADAQAAGFRRSQR